LTGMAETNAMINASNSRVKPPPSRAHGTLTFLDPTFGAAHAWHTGMQVGPVLEKVEMAPARLFGVMHRTIVSVAVRAVEAAAHGVVDVE